MLYVHIYLTKNLAGKNIDNTFDADYYYLDLVKISLADYLDYRFIMLETIKI